MEKNTIDKLLVIVERETGVKAREDSNIESLGIDSLDFIALIQTIRIEVGPITTRKATDAQTVKELAEAIEV